jgi:molybdopterin molybdotransferase
MSPDEARAAMLAAFAVKPGVESVALDAALGRVLAEDVVATRDQPPFANSAMDGYALRAADAPGQLRVVGESAAGRGFHGALKAGEAVRIFTGAPMPEGGDSVLIQEEAQRDGESLLAPTVKLGANVRVRGLDFHSGATLLRKGDRLDGIALALVAAVGAGSLKVVARPRIAVLATGDEIVQPGGAPSWDQIFESCSYGVVGLATQWGAVAQRRQSEGDKVDVLAAAIESALRDADLLITIGGASVGDHDLVRPVLKAFETRFAVEKIGVRPGKPTFFATTRLGAVLGLPGNPASGLACAYLFLRPLLEHWFGRDPAPVFGRAHLAAALPANGPREHYVRARTWQEGVLTQIQAAEDQDSSRLAIFQGADALIRLAPNAPGAEAGKIVDYLDLRRMQK